MQLEECLAIVRRRWLLLVSVFLLVMMAHLVWVSRGEETYAATTKVVVGTEPAFPSIRTTELPSPTAVSDGIADRPVLRRAAELALGTRDFESRIYSEERFVDRLAAGRIRMAAIYEPLAEDAVSAVANRLEESVTVTRGPERQFVEIAARSASPDDALLFSWAMAEGVHQYHAEQARERLQAFLVGLDREIETTRESVNTERAELEKAEADAGISDLAEQERVLHESIARVEEQQTVLEARVRQNDRIIQRRLHEQSFGGRLDVGAEAQAATSQRLDQIRDRLFAAKLDLEAKISNYSPKHHEVQKARSVIAGLEKAMGREQELVLGQRYRQFSEDTNELIQQNALHNLERDVLEDRRITLEDGLIALASTRKALEPKRALLAQGEERLQFLLDTQGDYAWYADTATLGAVTVYDPAAAAASLRTRGLKAGPFFLTLLLALALAIGTAALVEYFDTRVQSEQDLARYLDLPLVGTIARVTEGSCLLTEAAPHGEISEKFNTSSTLIHSAARELGLKTFMVTSALPGEGKTTVAVDLAVALARKSGRVLLVDGDLRTPSLHLGLRVDNQVGLSTALDSRLSPARVLDGAEPGSEVDPRHCVQRTILDNLDVVTAGPIPADPIPLLESGRLNRVLASLRAEYDFVVVDSPPVNKVADALSISSAVDGTLLVVGLGLAEEQDIRWAKHLLVNVQSNILGVFLNDPVKGSRVQTEASAVATEIAMPTPVAAEG